MVWLLGGYMWLFVHRPFEYYPALGDIQLERVYMIGMILAWVVTPDKQFSFNRLHPALALFTLAMLACWAASPYRDLTSDILENYIKVLVFYVLVVTTVRDGRGLRQLVAMYLIATGLYMAHSMLEYVNGRYEWRMGIRRMIGVDVTYRDPNAFASTLLLTLPMTLPFWRNARGSLRPLLAGYTAAVALCVFLTGSRTGFVGLIAVAVMLSWSSRYRARVLLLLACAGAVGVVALPGELQDRFLTIVDSSRGPENARESAEGRLTGLLDGLQLWEQSPLVGVGPAAFGNATGRGFNAHNLYGQVLGEMGTLGAVALAGLLLAYALNGREARRRARAPGADPGAADVCLAVGRTVLLLLLLGCAGHNLYRYNWLWLAAFQAVALGCLRRQGGPAALPARTRRPPARPALARLPA
jgi:O-antigen ligase